MKTRNGFVSNSSSTSYIVYIPNEFDIDKYKDKIKELLMSTFEGDFEDYDGSEVYEDNINEYIDEVFNKFKQLKNYFKLHQYDEYTYMQSVIEICKKLNFVLTEFDSRSEDSMIISVNILEKEINKWKEILNENS